MAAIEKSVPLLPVFDATSAAAAAAAAAATVAAPACVCVPSNMFFFVLFLPSTPRTSDTTILHYSLLHHSTRQQAGTEYFSLFISKPLTQHKNEQSPLGMFSTSNSDKFNRAQQSITDRNRTTR